MMLSAKTSLWSGASIRVSSVVTSRHVDTEVKFPRISRCFFSNFFLLLLWTFPVSVCVAAEEVAYTHICRPHVCGRKPKICESCRETSDASAVAQGREGRTEGSVREDEGSESSEEIKYTREDESDVSALSCSLVASGAASLRRSGPSRHSLIFSGSFTLT